MLTPTHLLLFTTLFLLFSNADAQVNNSKSMRSIFNYVESITGKRQQLQTPFTTAGDKLYMIGFQDGTFPDIGWHIKGEMGGIWHHPIKLLDGFSANITIDGKSHDLNKADAFTNFPFGNKHSYNSISDKISIDRFQVVPDEIGGIYIEYFIKNKSAKRVKVVIDITAISNLMPVWLGERTGMMDGKDTVSYDAKNKYWLAKDASNPWFVVYGSSLAGESMNHLGTKAHKKNTTVTVTRYSLEIKPNSSYSFPFIVAGSSKSKEEATTWYHQVRTNAYALISKKKSRVLALDNHSKVTLSDKELETTFRWLKYNCDWLTIDVDGLGKGICAGFPDYPWWFGGDITYTLRGLITTGRKDLAYPSIELLQSVSEKVNGNGRIIHEVSTNGAVYNLGNVNETPQFISLIWDIFCWTGDKDFLVKYFPAVQKGLTWLLKENDRDGNLLPDGNGMMEIHGLNSEMIDVAAYAQKAFDDAAQMAKILGKEQLSNEYKRNADIIKNKINTDFWVKDFNSYADFIGTKEQALKLADDAHTRADTLKKPWAVAEIIGTKNKLYKDTSTKKRGFVLYHNWVVNTPMETGVAEKVKALLALQSAQRFSNPYGMFVTGIDRDETAGEDENSYAATANKKEFTYTGAVMTLATGVQIIAENNYGRPNEAYQLLKKVSKTFSYALPGSIYEISPDYGMMTQAWNIYAFGEPIVEQFFGIKPMAYKKEVFISPLLPLALKDGKIENVVIGNNEVSLSFSQTATANHFVINHKKDDWIITFSQPKGKYKKWMVNNRVIIPESVGEMEQIKILIGTTSIKLNK